MSDVPMTPVPLDDPMRQAWEAYKQTDHFHNSLMWAENVRIENNNITHPHILGSLWAMFVQGWRARETHFDNDKETTNDQ